MNHLVSSFIFAALLHLDSAQTDNFVVKIVEYVPPSFVETSFRCLATVIHSRFLLTTAHCASIGDGSTRLAIDTGILVTDINSTVSTSIVTIKKTFIHAEYDPSKNRFNNIALIEADNDFNTTAMRPQTLGGLETGNITCNLVTRFSGMPNLVRNAVPIFNSAFCDPNFDQIFCTTFATSSENNCSAYGGSPLVCNDGAVDGFVISNRDCSFTDNKYMLYYHSVGEFRLWITDITGAGMKTKASAFLILSAMLITAKSFV